MLDKERQEKPSFLVHAFSYPEKGYSSRPVYYIYATSLYNLSHKKTKNKNPYTLLVFPIAFFHYIVYNKKRKDDIISSIDVSNQPYSLLFLCMARQLFPLADYGTFKCINAEVFYVLMARYHTELQPKLSEECQVCLHFYVIRCSTSY
jgi:hypothetical protein